MSELETSAEISDSAERWLARVERGLTDEEQVLFQVWLAGDARRRGAFLRAEAAMHLIDRACRTAPQGANDSAPRSARRALLAGGLAAAVLGAVGVAWVSTSAPDVTRETVTSVGEIRQVPLEDGSTVLLNTDSSMSVRLGARRRTVRLDRGEGLFKVAKDRARPFVVETDLGRVTAVGTAFSVRRHPDRIDVVVTEGVVEVGGHGRGSAVARLGAGSRAMLSKTGALQVSRLNPEDVARNLAWENGSVSLAGDTLQAAANEFNRYNQKKIVVHPALAHETVVGWFEAKDPAGFARAAAVSFDGEVLIEGQTIRIRPRK